MEQPTNKIIEFPTPPQVPTMVPVTEPNTKLVVVDGKLQVENNNENTNQ